MSDSEALSPDVLEFATARQQLMDELVATLRRSVRLAINRWPDEGWNSALLARVRRTFRQEYIEETDAAVTAAVRQIGNDLVERAEAALDQTTEDEDRDAQVERITEMLAVAVANAVTEARGVEADEPMVKTWVTMQDANVRASHRAAHGQTVPVGQSFEVGGTTMVRPGDLSAPVDEWINCRCVLAIAPASRTAAGILTGTTDTGGSMDPDEIALMEGELTVDSVPFYGVLAPEGVPTADGRRFAKDSMRWRTLPIPLLFQKQTGEGHDGSVIVGVIETLERGDDDLLWAAGRMLNTAEADEATNLMAEGALRGVSVDVYDATVEMQDVDGVKVDEESLAELDEDVELLHTLTDGEIAGATLCAFPAFREAFIALGRREDASEPQTEEPAEGAEADAVEAAVDEGSWDGDASNYTPEQWYSATLIHLSDDKEKKSDHKLPIRTPDGDLSRAGVHAAASRINQTEAPDEQISKAKSALRSAYKELGEDPPEVIETSAEGAEEFVDIAPGKTEDGPGWLTHPVDTDRLRDYWVRGAGAAKIAWGTPGDFNRCRANLAKYIKPQYLSGYCANRHYDALGTWPGRHAAEGGLVASGDPWSLTASGSSELPPADWFEDPGLTEPTPIVITDDGRIFGHLATWGTCHIGFSGVCTTPPHSIADYSYFTTGVVRTAGGDRRVGQITLDTGHADTKFTATPAMAHYDDTGVGVADVSAGEDSIGIWVAGAIRPGVKDEAIETLRASALSGDWRAIGGNLELIAALAVNVPGFPIPRATVAASGGRQTALVASGIVSRQEFSVSDIEAITRQVIEQDRQEREARVELGQLAAERNKKKMAEIAASRKG